MKVSAQDQGRALTLPLEDGTALSGVQGRQSAAPPSTTGRPAARDGSAAGDVDQSARQELDNFARLIAAGLADEDRRAWCTITVLGLSQHEIVAASSDHARALEVAQLRLADGPCLRAGRDQVLIHVGDTGTDPRWWSSAAATIHWGIRSVLALPFELAGAGPASLNIRCNRPHAFDSAQIGTMQQLLEAASDASLEMAEQLPHRRAADLEMAAAAVSRALVQQCANRLVKQRQCTREEAFHFLASTADLRGMPLRELAAELVGATLRRA